MLPLCYAAPSRPLPAKSNLRRPNLVRDKNFDFDGQQRKDEPTLLREVLDQRVGLPLRRNVAQGVGAQTRSRPGNSKSNGKVLEHSTKL